jgi:hypothetical protein
LSVVEVFGAAGLDSAFMSDFVSDLLSDFPDVDGELPFFLA